MSFNQVPPLVLDAAASPERRQQVLNGQGTWKSNATLIG